MWKKSIIFDLYSKDYNYPPNINQNNADDSESLIVSKREELKDELSISSSTTGEIKNFRFEFITTDQIKFEIVLDKSRTIKELIKYFFKGINRLDLFEDRSVYFLYQGKRISYESNDLISDYFRSKYNDGNITILVITDEELGRLFWLPLKC